MDYALHLSGWCSRWTALSADCWTNRRKQHLSPEPPWVLTNQMAAATLSQYKESPDHTHIRKHTEGYEAWVYLLVSDTVFTCYPSQGVSLPCWHCLRLTKLISWSHSLLFLLEGLKVLFPSLPSCISGYQHVKTKHRHRRNRRGC